MISIDGLAVEFSGTTLFSDISFVINEKDRIALMGKNGAGKSTLLKILAGVRQPTRGKVSAPKDCVVAYLPQHLMTEDGRTVFAETAQAFAHLHEMEARIDALNKELETRTDYESDSYMALIEEVSALSEKFYSIDATNYEEDVEKSLLGLGFTREDFQRQTSDFSGGWRMRIELAKLLLQKPDVLLLDEPTNHLDIAAVEWLENYLKSYENAVIIVSHDRMFLDRVIDVTYEIEYGDIKRYPGNYSAFVKQKEEAQIKQEKDYEAQQKEIERLTAWIEKWKNTPTKVAATRSKRMAIEHMVKIEKPRRFDTRTFHALFHPVRESYTDVLTMKKLKIGYDTVLSEVSAVIKKAERIVLIGENGKGKSTLLKTVVGEINPLGGSYQFGNRVDFAYFDQHKAVNQKFDPEQTVLDYFWSLYPNLLRNDVRSALGAFLFSGEDVEKKMGQLSGGEKVRLELCRIFYTKPNFLILDEPITGLDPASTQDFYAVIRHLNRDEKVAVLMVSHDIGNIVTQANKILQLKQTVQFYGTVDEYKKSEFGREFLGGEN